jgi:Swi5
MAMERKSLLRELELAEEVGGVLRPKYSARVISIALLMAETTAILRDIHVREDDLPGEERKAIKLLHRYNEMKDLGQDLMGIIAQRRGITLKEANELYLNPSE